MPNLGHQIIKIHELYQVCMVVHDMDKSMALLWDTFGIGPWDIYIRDCHSKLDTELIQDMTYYGKPAQFSFKVALTHDNPGSLQIEIIQPVGGDNIYRDFLKKNGDGLQHLGSHYVDSKEAFTETGKNLEKAGFPCMMSMRTYNANAAYFDTTEVLNTILEVVWRDPSRSRPAPGRVFPAQ